LDRAVQEELKEESLLEPVLLPNTTVNKEIKNINIIINIFFTYNLVNLVGIGNKLKVISIIV